MEGRSQSRHRQNTGIGGWQVAALISSPNTQSHIPLGYGEKPRFTGGDPGSLEKQNSLLHPCKNVH